MSTSSRKALERLPAMPRRRIDDLPFAAVVLRRLLRFTNARRVVFSASGLREGWFMRRMSDEIRAQDPLLSGARDLAARHGRDFDLPPALLDWTLPLFPTETAEATQLREAACWMSDIGSRDHPEFRAEQAFLRVFRQQGLALDHRTRAFLALTVAIRYDAELNAPFLQPALLLLDAMTAARAELLGIALRLGYTLSAGTKDLLTATRLQILDTRLILRLRENSGVFAGESISRRLGRLALGLGLAPVVEPDVPNGGR